VVKWPVGKPIADANNCAPPLPGSRKRSAKKSSGRSLRAASTDAGRGRALGKEPRTSP
jgi:hypothetical protein